jgi:hypothetical protein
MIPQSTTAIAVLVRANPVVVTPKVHARVEPWSAPDCPTAARFPKKAIVVVTSPSIASEMPRLLHFEVAV